MLQKGNPIIQMLLQTIDTPHLHTLVRIKLLSMDYKLPGVLLTLDPTAYSARSHNMVE